MVVEFEGDMLYWRGPAPWFFIGVPEVESKEIKAVEKFCSYGWGMIPVRAVVMGVEFETALFPKDGKYLMPLKVALRKKIGLDEGDRVAVRLEVVMKFEG